MSADTAIGIGYFPDGYRHSGVVQAIENLDSHRYKSDKERQKAISEYEWSKPYKTEKECYKQAQIRLDEYRDMEYPLEYGIVDVGEFPFTI